MSINGAKAFTVAAVIRLPLRKTPCSQVMRTSHRWEMNTLRTPPLSITYVPTKTLPLLSNAPASQIIQTSTPSPYASAHDDLDFCMILFCFLLLLLAFSFTIGYISGDLEGSCHTYETLQARTLVGKDLDSTKNAHATALRKAHKLVRNASKVEFRALVFAAKNRIAHYMVTVHVRKLEARVPKFTTDYDDLSRTRPTVVQTSRHGPWWPDISVASLTTEVTSVVE
jgi:hypothetical protein